jgi:hypothetical protein
METLINKVTESGIITLNLEDFFPKEVAMFDLKSYLFMELILKEKEFRAALLATDWSVFAQKSVILTCSADAIIPVWAYMLVSSYLQPVANDLQIGDEAQCKQNLLLRNIEHADLHAFEDKRVVVKGCGELPIPESAYALITFRLRALAKSIMYGEPCSTVPIFKKKLL